VSPELFRDNIRVLADLVQKKAKERFVGAETAYNIRGSNLMMQVDFSIKAEHGRDDLLIAYENGDIWFSMLH
jgi:hypothetical protein